MDFLRKILFKLFHNKKRKLDISWYEKDKLELLKQIKERNIPFIISSDIPCLNERYEDGGNTSGHYFHQDLWVAHQIYKSNPIKHLDIGSRIDGFVAHVASFREIEVMDIRKLSNDLINIEFIQADLMVPLDKKYWNYCDSISSLHAIEHFGLGRYGDTIDADGHIKGLENIYKLLKPDGRFYFSVPIGPQRIEFNAHRIFSINYLLDYFNINYTLESFSFIDDKFELHRNVILNKELKDTNCGCIHGCGIFILRKK